jgi:interferon gamma-inducible protein 30
VALVSATAETSSPNVLSRSPAPEHDSKSGESLPEGTRDQEDKNWIRNIPLVGGVIAASIDEATKREPVREADRVPADRAPKVKVDVYIEAACPGCQFFTTHVLVPVMKEEGMAGITDLNVVPAGNAEIKKDEETSKEVVDCQHGEGECEGNKIVSCLAETYRNDPAFVPVLGCIEEHAGVASDVFASVLSNLTAVDMMRNNAGICLAKAHLNVQQVEGCSSSSQGDAMLRAAVRKTESLSPAFEYAPWVVVDGDALKDDAYNLKMYICNRYTGPLPEACLTPNLKDYFPDTSSDASASGTASAASAASSRGLGRRTGKVKLAGSEQPMMRAIVPASMEKKVRESARAARADISAYFKTLQDGIEVPERMKRAAQSVRTMEKGVQESARAARVDISTYFNRWMHVYTKEDALDRKARAALRTHPHLALMQELLEGEMAAPRRGFMFCAKRSRRR